MFFVFFYLTKKDRLNKYLLQIRSKNADRASSIYLSIYRLKEIDCREKSFFRKKRRIIRIEFEHSMGAYLSSPICDKDTHEGANTRLAFAASSMQGWRMSQEVKTLDEYLRTNLVF